VLEGRTGEAASGDGTRIWAGRTGDSSYIDLSLLGIVNGAVSSGTAPDLTARRPDRRVVRRQAGHRRGRLAPDQPRRALHDVADLLSQ
jgi:hypothetical protein